jgi:3-deoxy-manno-octulosonate cytidylyltransferase (CMP-KDO synthetase)
MVEHVYRRVALCHSLRGVYVATCDREIYDCVRGFGGEAIMTSPTHPTASDRVAEAAQHISAGILVMVQGDEPMVVPEMIDRALAAMQGDPACGCVNLARRINDESEFLDTNTIKVVMDREGNALMFSREPIPTRRLLGFGGIHPFKQVCIIPFRRQTLLQYAQLERSAAEMAESVDMLRLLEHGIEVRMVETEFDTHSVDTRADLKAVEKRMPQDPLVRQYAPQDAIAVLPGRQR